MAGTACPACGTTVPEGSRFCSNCGTKVVRTCPACSREHTGRESYCQYCGTKLEKPENGGAHDSTEKKSPADTETTESHGSVSTNGREDRGRSSRKQVTGTSDSEQRGDPWIAAVLSLFLPGTGFIYAGEVVAGVVGIVLYIVVIWGLLVLLGTVVFPAITALTFGTGAVLYLLLPLFLVIAHIGAARETYLTIEELNAEVSGASEPGAETSGTEHGESGTGESTNRAETAGPLKKPTEARDFEELSYRDLQELAKDVDGLRANRSREKLIAELGREYGIENAYVTRPNTAAELETYSYRELQELAKELGIAANQSSEDLREEIATVLDID